MPRMREGTKPVSPSSAKLAKLASATARWRPSLPTETMLASGALRPQLAPSGSARCRLLACPSEPETSCHASPNGGSAGPTGRRAAQAGAWIAALSSRSAWTDRLLQLKLYVPLQCHKPSESAVTSAWASNPMNVPVPPENVAVPLLATRSSTTWPVAVFPDPASDDVGVKGALARRLGVDDLRPRFDSRT